MLVSSFRLCCVSLLASYIVFVVDRTRTGGNIGVRARGSTEWITSSSSSILPEVRFEFDRNRFAVLSVRVRCIFKLDEAILLRCRTEALSSVSHYVWRFNLVNLLLAADAACQH